MTPTEAAALGALLSIIISLAYRRLTFAIFKRSLLETARITAMVMVILGMAVTLGHVFQSVGFIERVTHFFINLPVGRYGVLAIFFFMYLVLGCFFDSWTMLLLTLPFVMPVIIGLNINPFWWGIFYVVVAEFGIITPPFGLSLFIIHGIVPQYPIETIVRGSIPFAFSVVALEVLLVVFPQIALWLPTNMF
ncbi:MAG: TRAP transporter large permease subunit, partial [Chloroflexota bacterium]|nr:TRAP transporter large permease subunit [Chloroflexota bacterium]